MLRIVGVGDWKPGVPMSTSEPSRSRVASRRSSRSKTTRWPWRSMRKIEPPSASGARSYSGRSDVGDDHAVAVEGSKDLMTPCTAVAQARQWVAFTTLPALMHDVQTSMRLVEPLTTARTRWMFGFQRRLVRRWEWLTFIPNDGCLPHTSQTAAMTTYTPQDTVGETAQRRYQRTAPAHNPHRSADDARPAIGGLRDRYDRRDGGPGSHRRDLRAVIRGYAEALAAHKAVINRLNVYPVPDGDTGTNMALTLESVVAELDPTDGAGDDLAATCKAIAHGSLMGARGNSGVILSQILRGLCEVVRDARRDRRPAVLAEALEGAVDAPTAR